MPSDNLPLNDLLLDAPVDDSDGIMPEQEQEPLSNPSAMVLDSWTVQKGRDILGASARLARDHGIDDDSDFATTEQAAMSVGDFYSLAFEPAPIMADNTEATRRQEYIKTLTETEEYRAIRISTMLNEPASVLATVAMSSSFVAMCAAEDKSEEPGEKGDGPEKHLREARAARNGLAESAKDIKDLEDLTGAVGIGNESGAHGSTGEITAMFQRLRESKMIRAVCAMAGRYRRFAQGAQRQRTDHGQDDIVGVELGNDLGRILPQELLAIDEPLLAMDAMRRFLERGLLCREFSAEEPVAKGPIVVVVDESGSMKKDDKIIHGKAIALALYWVATHQKRWCAMIGFGTAVQGHCLTIPPGKPDGSKIIEWADSFYGGGTSCEVPLIQTPATWEEMGAPAGKTDMILITDASIRVPHSIRDSFLEWKKRSLCRLTTLVIGRDDAGPLGAVSDSVHILEDLAPDEPSVREVLSL